MIRTDKRMRLGICLLVVMLAFIWGNSLLPGEISGALSEWFHGMLARLLNIVKSGPGGSGLLRKMAHFAEFCALGLCLGWLFGMMKKGVLWPFLLGVGVACVDEGIQLFVPARGPALRDVCIDAAGVAAGILLLLFGHYLNRKRKSIPNGGKST